MQKEKLIYYVTLQVFIGYLQLSTDEVLCQYFYAGYHYKTILLMLEKYHGEEIGLRTLMRRLEKLGLKRRGNSVNMDTVFRNRMELQSNSNRDDGVCRISKGLQINMAHSQIETPFDSTFLFFLSY